ncbi:MAG: GAF domain-containing sensor histidine kinase [Candidatus Limnocylindria bacterium]
MAPSRRHLLLPPVFAALDDWLADLDPGATPLAVAIRALGDELGVDLGRLRVSAPPLPELDLQLGAAAGEEMKLRMPGVAEPIGQVQIAGEVGAVEEMARGLELLFADGRARAQANRSTRQLRALDEAVRGIGGVLDVDRVLQHIVDRVRDLVDAQYAAIGIVDADGAIERFITSGISDEARARIGDLPHGRGLLGLIIRENRTYRIPDIEAHPERYGFPANHPEMHSFLGMPITAQGVAVGRLYLTNKIGAAEFSPDDQELVEMFALHAGIAIENARLHEQVRRLAIVDERDRISRDLHDSVIQAIYAQTLALDDVPEIIGEDPDEAGRRVDEAIDALHAVIRDIRNFIFGLRPVLLEAGSLGDGLRHLATELHRNGGVEVSVSVVDDARVSEELSIEVVAELLAVTREALSNVARHASATTASVELDATPRELRLELADNGRGFDAQRAVEHGHHGLANMRARVRALAGTFEVRSKPEAGTRIIISLPRRATADEGDHA